MLKVILFATALLVAATANAEESKIEPSGWILWVGELFPNNVVRETVSSEDYPDNPLNFKAGAYTACFMGDLEVVHQGGHKEAFANTAEKLALDGNPPDVQFLALSRLVCVTVYEPKKLDPNSRIAHFEVEVVTPVDGVITGFRTSASTRWQDGDIRGFEANGRIIYVQLSKIRD